MSMSPNNVYIVFDDKFFSFVRQNANILCLVIPHYAIFSVCVCQYCLRPMARTKPNRQERANVQSTLKVTDKSLGTSCVCCYRIVWSVVVFFSMMSGDQGCLVCSVHWLDFFFVVPLSVIRCVWWNAECFILSWPGFPKQQCWYHTGHNWRAHCRGCERFPRVSPWLTDKLTETAYVITLYRIM